MKSSFYFIITVFTLSLFLADQSFAAGQGGRGGRGSGRQRGGEVREGTKRGTEEKGAPASVKTGQAAEGTEAAIAAAQGRGGAKELKSDIVDKWENRGVNERHAKDTQDTIDRVGEREKAIVDSSLLEGEVNARTVGALAENIWKMAIEDASKEYGSGSKEVEILKGMKDSALSISKPDREFAKEILKLVSATKKAESEGRCEGNVCRQIFSENADLIQELQKRGHINPGELKRITEFIEPGSAKEVFGAQAKEGMAYLLGLFQLQKIAHAKKMFPEKKWGELKESQQKAAEKMAAADAENLLKERLGMKGRDDFCKGDCDGVLRYFGVCAGSGRATAGG